MENTFNATSVVDFNYIGFKIAFAVENSVSKEGFDDPTYLRWRVRFRSNPGGNLNYFSPELKVHKCIDEDFDAFFPPN